MPDLIIVATIDALPGHEAEVRAALEKVVPPSRAEPACGRYDLHLDIAQPGRFVMLESWRDAAALAAHEASPHFLTLVREVGGKARIETRKLHQL